MLTTFRTGPVSAAILLVLSVWIVGQASSMSRGFDDYLSFRKEISSILDRYTFKPPETYPKRAESDREAYLEGFKYGWYMIARYYCDPGWVLEGERLHPPFPLPDRLFFEREESLTLFELGHLHGSREGGRLTARVTTFGERNTREFLTREFAIYLEGTTPERFLDESYSWEDSGESLAQLLN